MGIEVSINKTKIYNIDYHVIDKCNQNCVSCGHFCSLVPKDTPAKSLDIIKKDFSLLSQYCDCFECLTLTGGECTLNPDLNDILYLAREYFPNNVINLYTNGTTVGTIEKFKQTIKDNSVHVIATIYPNIGDKVFDMSDKLDCDVEYRTNPEHFHKTFFSGNICATDYEIYHCGARGICCQLVNGKLYPCQYAAQFNYFDEYFKGQHKLKLNGNEYIDLNNKPTGKELIKFIYQSNFELCKHCLDAKRNCGTYFNDIEWGRTKKEIDEWYIDEYIPE